LFKDHLVNSILATDTTIEVEDGASFPQNQVFEIWIDREKLVCTSFASANVMNVQRGYEGTQAVAHDAETLIAIDTEVKQNVRTSKALDTHIDATDPHTGYVLESSEDASGYGFVLDEDDMASDSASKVPTQQSVKAYVDAQIGTAEEVSDTVGAMVTGNTETFITVTYQDADNTLDFVVPVKDEDNMASDSATDLPTQQSVKAYVDTHAAAVLSSTVHPNTTACHAYNSATQLYIPTAKTSRVELDSTKYDDGPNFKTDYVFNQVQADADSSSTKIEDDSVDFQTITGKTNGLRYALVTWSSDAGGTANTGSGYITTVAAHTLTIYKTNGADFAASYYYTIKESWYEVPTTGYYLIIAQIWYNAVNMDADKTYRCGVRNNGDNILQNVFHSSSEDYCSTIAMGRMLLTEGDLITLTGYHVGDDDTIQFYGGTSGATTFLQIVMMSAS